PARLASVKQGKQVADLQVLERTYFVRNNVPFIRGAEGEEFKLIPLEKMEYTPTAVQIQASTKLTEPLAKYKDYVIRVPSTVVLADVVDHRANQTPVKNQSGRGTCVCFASLAGLEVAYSSGSLDLSENYANYLYMKAEGRVCKDDGLKTTDSADYLSANGVCVESVCPYQTSFPAFCNNGANPAPTQRANAAAAAPYRIKSFQKIWRKDDLTTDTGLWINNPRYLEAILDSGKDIVFGTHVAGWTYPYSGILDVKLGPSGDPLPSVGGHAMLIVGYNRPQEYFIVKNSWGTNKGQSGYFYLSYDYIRTYAKYGYIINEVYPIPLQVHPGVLKIEPKAMPQLQRAK
ncbi:MAG: C1 family peptidase, partial [Armatimonadetes bacterium]|nr:C1 family peptidase [Armatimonadota bacterium]